MAFLIIVLVFNTKNLLNFSLVSKRDQMQIRMREINLQFSQSARQNILHFKRRTLETVILPARILPRKSVNMTCPNCLTGILTFQEYKVNNIFTN